MSRLAVFTVCLALGMMLVACGEKEYTTSVTGVVMDDSTGKPLAGASLFNT